MDQRSLIDDIPAFLAVARARSFTRAAAQLGISSPGSVKRSALWRNASG